MPAFSHSALILGASGGLGGALMAAQHASGTYAQVLGLSRSQRLADHETLAPTLDLTHEASIIACAAWVQARCAEMPLRLLIVATGALHDQGTGPERSLSQLDMAYLQRMFAINSIGPALLLKHFAPLLPREGDVKLVFISAKVGSIGDNALGGWYGYRASKAALNQIVKTAAIELARRNKHSCCIALHPGTVDTALSQPFSKSGLNIRSPETAAQEISQVIAQLTAQDNGSFLDYQGQALPW
jgi:NAD(P)-dependent dehydrogenase (short-subunit alcohol dehydrogenase family)